MAILITNKFPKYINLTASSVNSMFLTWGQSIPARFWGTETPEYWGGIDEQAQEHYDRVIADGGVLPSGLGGVNSFFQVVKEIYSTADINTAISVGLDPQVLGYKLGAGSGTTLGQAAQKLYSVKSTENLLTFSEQFDNANWAKTNLTVSANATTSPSGILNADKLIATAIDSNHILSQSPASFTPLTAYTFSYYAKSAEYTKCGIRIGGTGYVTTPLAAINLTDGSIISQQGFTSLTVTLTNNNWYRISGTFTSATGLTTNIQPLSDSYTIIANNFSFLGNGTSGIYAWGAQLNTDSVALPYTPTTTTAETLADVVQTTAASQPLLLVHSGANYLWSSGVTGNNCTTSTNSSFQVNGDFTIDFNVSDLVTSGEYICKGNSTDGFVIFLNAGAVRYTFFDTGVRTVDLTSQPINLVTQKWCRVQRSGFNYSWWTSTDGITFTQVGLNVVDIVVTKAITAPLRIGQGVNFYASPCVMKTYRARFYNDATQTTLISDFNPNQYNAATSQTQWTSSTGEIWSVQTGTATTGYKGVLVDRTIVQSDGVGDYLDNPTFLRNSLMTQYLAYSAQAVSSGAQAQIIDSSLTNYNNSICQTASNMFSWLNSSLSNIVGSASIINRRNILAVNYNAGVNNNIKTNDIIGTINTYSPTPSGVGIRLFSKGGTVSSHNATITTYVCCSNNDTANNTTMFNFLKTLNNL
jgi:hypothetical protein